jgi:predicted GNAT family acetyltransferase
MYLAVLHRMETSEGGQDIMDIHHTYSPPSARGKGLAAQLSNEAFRFAEEHKHPIRASCSYIRDTYLPSGKGEAGKWVLDEESNIASLKSS